jgi:hypothetical protein
VFAAAAAHDQDSHGEALTMVCGMGTSGLERIPPNWAECACGREISSARVPDGIESLAVPSHREPL